MMKVLFDEYDLKTKIVPALISLAPIIGWMNIVNFNWLIIDNGIKGWALDFSVSFTFVIFQAFFIRALGKYIIEEVMFKGGLEFPTTRMLLNFDSTLDPEIKKRVREKVEHVTKVKLPDEDAERDNPSFAKRKLLFAVDIIRQHMRGKSVLQQKNIEYGFWRNLSAALIVVFFICIILLIISTFVHIPEIEFLMIVALVYVLLILIGLFFVNMTARTYGRQFFAEYLSK